MLKEEKGTERESQEGLPRRKTEQEGEKHHSLQNSAENCSECETCEVVARCNFLIKQVNVERVSFEGRPVVSYSCWLR